MEPITAALLAGAAVVAHSLTDAAVADAYQALKRSIRRLLSDDDGDALEKAIANHDPDTIEATLKKHQLDRDSALRREAEALLARLPSRGDIVIEDLKARGNIRIKGLSAGVELPKD